MYLLLINIYSTLVWAFWHFYENKDNIKRGKKKVQKYIYSTVNKQKHFKDTYKI